MKEMHPNRFLIKDFIEKCKTKENIDILKKTLDLYKNNNKRTTNKIVIEKLEFLILCELAKYLEDMDSVTYRDFIKTHDLNAIVERSKELSDKFLEPYVIDKSVTA